MNACWSRQRFSVVEFSCIHTIKHNTQKRRSESPGGVETGRHPSTVLQQSSRLFFTTLPTCFPLHTQTHTHSILLFLSPLQSSIIVSPHRHCRQWEVEWEKVKLICGHALCYCFNKNSQWTWQLHKYNKEAFGEASNMFPLYRRPLRYSVMDHYIEYLQINHKVVCDSFWSLAEEEEQWCLILTSN